MRAQGSLRLLRHQCRPKRWSHCVPNLPEYPDFPESTGFRRRSERAGRSVRLAALVAYRSCRWTGLHRRDGAGRSRRWKRKALHGQYLALWSPDSAADHPPGVAAMVRGTSIAATRDGFSLSRRRSDKRLRAHLLTCICSVLVHSSRVLALPEKRFAEGAACSRERVLRQVRSIRGRAAR